MIGIKRRTVGLKFSRFSSALALWTSIFSISVLIIACQPKKKFDFHKLPESSSPASAGFSFAIAPIFKSGTSEKETGRFVLTAQKWIYPESESKQRGGQSSSSTEKSPQLKSYNHRIVISRSESDESSIELKLEFEKYSIHYPFKIQELQKLTLVDFFYEQLNYLMGVLCRDEKCESMRLCFPPRLSGRFAPLETPFDSKCSSAWEFKLTPITPPVPESGLTSDSQVSPDGLNSQAVQKSSYRLSAFIFSKRDKNGNLVEDAIQVEQCKKNPTSADSNDLEASCFHY